MTTGQFHRIAAAAADLHALARDNPELEKALCELGSALADVLCPPEPRTTRMDGHGQSSEPGSHA